MNDDKQGTKQETIKVKAVSEFHKGLSVCFQLHEGVNIVKLPDDREDYCLDHDINSDTCGCGYPISRTKWVCPTGWEVDESCLEIIPDETDPCDLFGCELDDLDEYDDEYKRHYEGYSTGMLQIVLTRTDDE